VLDPHATVPLVELFEEIWIDLEEIERRRIRKGRRLHEAQKQKQIVQLGGLLPKVVLVATERDAVHELPQAAAKGG
jgi:lipase chaperone LimK